MLTRVDDKLIENPLKVGPIYFILQMKTNYDFSKFVNRFGDMHECPMKLMFETFCRVLEQSYIYNKEKLEEDEIKVYFSYYEEKKIVIMSTDLPEPFFYNIYEMIIALEIKKKLIQCFFKQGIFKYFNEFCDEMPDDSELFKSTYNYERAFYIAKKEKLIKTYTEEQLEKKLEIDFDDEDDDESLNHYEISSMIDNSEQLDPIEIDDDYQDQNSSEEEEENEVLERIIKRIDKDVEMTDTGEVDKDVEMINANDDDEIEEEEGEEKNTNEYTWKVACMKILKSYNESMTIGEIHDLILSRKYKKATSTSQATCSSAITESIKNFENIFVRTEPGKYFLFVRLTEEDKKKVLKEQEIEQQLVKEENDIPRIDVLDNVPKTSEQIENEEPENDEGYFDSFIKNILVEHKKEFEKRGKTIATFDLIRNPDQQYSMSLRHFNCDGLLKTSIPFVGNNSFDNLIKRDLVDAAEVYNIQHIKPQNSNYSFNFNGENQINMLKCFQGRRNDDDQNQGNNRAKKRKFEQTFGHYLDRFDTKERKRLKVMGYSNRDIKKLQDSVSIYNFPFYKLSMDEQLRFRSSTVFVKWYSELYNETITNKKVLRKKKKKMFKDMMNSEIANYLAPDVLNLLFRSWNKILEERIFIDNDRLIKKYIDPSHEIDEIEEEGEEDSDEEMEEKEIKYNELTSILHRYEHIGRDLNLMTNFLSFDLCWFSLLSGLISDFDESMINVLLLALPGGGKTFVLNKFFEIFREFVDMFTMKQTNKVGTIKINKSNHKSKVYPETPHCLLKSLDQLKNPNDQQARSNLLTEIDQKYQSSEFLCTGRGTEERVSKKVAKHNCRPVQMASIRSMSEDDGGARRIFQKILEKGSFDTSDLYMIKKFKDFDKNSKVRENNLSKHLYFLTKCFFMYHTIHFTSVMDNKPTESVTDFYGLLMERRIAKEYERLFKKKVSTDTLKRVRVATRIQCILRVIQELFCYKDSKFAKSTRIDPFTFYKEVQKKAYVIPQDLVFSINLMNDEFYDKTVSKFMLNVMKLYNLDKLDDGDDKIFGKRENLAKFYNEVNQTNIRFEKRKEGFGGQRKVYVNPNYIIFDTKQNKWEFYEKIAKATNLPKQEILKVLKKLKFDITEKPYKEICIEWSDEMDSGGGRTKFEKRTLTQLKTENFMFEPIPQSMNWFYDKEWHGSYQMVFNIRAFLKKSTHTKDQFNILKTVIENVFSYEKCGIDKLLMLNEVGQNCVLDMQKVLREKYKVYKEEWENMQMDEEFDTKFNLVPENQRDSYVKSVDREIRKDVGFHEVILVQNLLNSEGNKFKFDKEDDFDVSRSVRKLFTKDTIKIRHNIGDINKSLHKKMLKENR